MTDQDAIERLSRTLEAHSERIRQLELMEAEAKVARVQTELSLKNIQSDLRWLLRIVIGFVVVALLGIVISSSITIPPV